MRKPLVAAIAAVTAVGGATVAFAQNPAPSPTLDVTVTPTKAGTKRKPAPIKLFLSVQNNVESKTTMSKLEIDLPKYVKASGKGLPSCKFSTLSANGPAGCPRGSKAGSGQAHAQLNPSSAQPTPLTFQVTAFNGGATTLLFYLSQEGGSIKAALQGKLAFKGGKYNQKLTIAIPQNLQQPVPGVYSALVDFSDTLYLKKGRRSLLTTFGCKNKKHDFAAKLSYAPNPTPPAAPTATATASAPCTK